jgi:hypothetical protein
MFRGFILPTCVDMWTGTLNDDLRNIDVRLIENNEEGRE